MLPLFGGESEGGSSLHTNVGRILFFFLDGGSLKKKPDTIVGHDRRRKFVVFLYFSKKSNGAKIKLMPETCTSGSNLCFYFVCSVKIKKKNWFLTDEKTKKGEIDRYFSVGRV